MLAAPEFLIARPVPALVPVEDPREGLRVLIASLARGGAERIVLEWLDAEGRRGRPVELAVLHPRANAWRAPSGVTLIERRGEPTEKFMRSLAERWARDGIPVSTHLIDDGLLAILWQAGVATIPTVHNAREGWRNDPGIWTRERVPVTIACAESVRREVVAAGSAVPVHAIRHMPAAPRGAADAARREMVRAEWNVEPGTLLVGTVGAFKPQKDFPRAIEILGALRRHRDAALVILGGVLDATQLAELERTLERIAHLELASHVKLPGFVDPIGQWYAACDVVLSASRYEGLSMAAREALAAGLPVVALDVGGQSEIAHERLALLPPDASAESVAKRLAGLPVRAELAVEPGPRSPRVWSVAHAWRPAREASTDTLFVTANLNAGGAQRSLVNLASAIAPRHRIRVAVCGETTQDAFAATLREAGVRCFRPAPTPDPFALAESILIEASRARVRTICFWNADPRVKLLMAKFAPAELRLVDASPGAYAFEEMAREEGFAATITYSIDAYYARLDTLVLKHHASAYPPCRAVRVIPNGVAMPPPPASRSPHARFLVSGRIAPSKRLEEILEAFARAARTLRDPELHIVGQAEPRHARYVSGIVAAASALPVRFRGALPGLEHLSEPFTATIVLGTHQGCPNAVLEAMAAGIPVIANASGGTGELVRDGETGWLLPEAAGREELERAMRDCAASPERAAALAVRARDHVARNFSMEAMAARYLDCFTASVS
jgi:glycosyltransferase involved in cell wall biosynthesis